MDIYKFITPSDPITFRADCDKVAFTCALLLGNAKAGCTNMTTGKSLPTLLLFSAEAEKQVSDFIGGSLDGFIDGNKPRIAECFRSFAYGSVSDRQTFDDACKAITDAERLKEFRAKHEDRSRSSMSQWVKAAWEYSNHMS